MKSLPYLLFLSLLLLSCQPLRIIDNNKNVITDSTLLITHRDTLHVTVHDTVTTTTTHHVTLRDTTYTSEHIVIRYDRETGLPIERIEDRDIQQFRTLDSLYQRMLSLQHSLDSIRAIDQLQLTTSHTDSTYNEHIQERGDAARTTWQSFIHYLSRISSFLLLFAIIALSFFAFIRFRK